MRDARSGSTRRYVESVHLYTVAEIEELLERAGLEIEKLFGDFTGAPVGPDAPRLIVTGRKKGTAGASPSRETSDASGFSGK